MADDVLSGNQGTVGFNSSDLCNLSQWQMTLDQAVLETVTSCSSPWTITARGNKKVTGTISVKVDDVIRAESLFFTDALVALQLRTITGKYWSGNARIGQLQQSCNVETGALQELSCQFTGNGTWTLT